MRWVNSVAAVLSLLLIVAFVATGPAAALNASAVLTTDNPGTINALVVDPADPNTIYAATSLAGVLKSTDNGTTWLAVNTGLAPTVVDGESIIAVTDLAVDPIFTANLYLTTGQAAYKTTDGGNTWALMNVSSAEITPTSVTVYSKGSQYVCIGTAASGVFFSYNSGDKWSFYGGETYGRCNHLYLTYRTGSGSAEMGPADDDSIPNTVWLATAQGVWGGYRPLHGRPEWLPSTLSDSYIYTMYPSSYDTVTFAGAREGGLYASLDCQNWGQLSGGSLPPDIDINDLAEGPIAADSQNRPDMYAASYDGGLIKGVREDGAWAWAVVLDNATMQTDELHPVSTAVSNVESGPEADPHAPVVFVGSSDQSLYDQPLSGTIYRSPDGGLTWENSLANGYWTSQD